MDAAAPPPSLSPPPAGEAKLTQAAFFQRQAGEAWQAGQAALLGGDLPRARFWLERACRLAPDDASAALALAAAHLRSGMPADAVPLLERVTAKGTSREALLLLAAAYKHAGQPTAAATALAGLLSANLVAAADGLAGLARDIARQSGEAGWCGLTPEGDVLVELVAQGEAEWVLDGQAVSPADAVPPGSGLLCVTVAGRHCLGSPIDVRRARRLEGVVAAEDGGLEGWAWHPGDPEAEPVLTVQPAEGPGGFSVVASDQNIAATQPLARPRRFHVPAARLAGLSRPLRVVGPDGLDLAGSPLDPDAESRAAMAIAQAVARRFPLHPGPVPLADDPLCHAAMAATLRGPACAAPCMPERPVAVVVPVYRGLAVTRHCLDSVFATIPAGTAVVVVDDATPEPALAEALDALHEAGRIRLLRHAANRGFPASANAGIRLAAGLPGAPDIVLLNSDTQVAAGWIEGLRAAVHQAGDIGTGTPLSNDATILTYPDPVRPAAAPQGVALARLARQAARANAGATVDIPTAVGFCMYIRHECLQATGVFREDVFAQGYGEENDFCLRASHLGWRHVAVPGVYVAHVGGQSFGAAAAHLVARNLAVLERLHPGYRDAIAAFQARDPLAGARRRLDILRWQAARRGHAGGAAILITHDSGGGVERVVRERCAALHGEGRRPIVLRPVLDRLRAGPEGGPAYRTGCCRVDDGDGGSYPNLLFEVPRELGALAKLLRADRPAVMEVHHLLGHDHALLRLAETLAIPLDVHLHDYAWFCPRMTLVGPDRRYCGEPSDTRHCDACVADAGRAIEEDISAAALRARSAHDLARARRVVAPSADTASRMRRQFPGLAPEVVAHEDDAASLAIGAASGAVRGRPAPGRRRRVCVIGGIGPEKGYDMLLGCARDAALRNLPLEFVLVGHTPDDQRLLATGRVSVTGTYREGEGEALIRRQQVDLAWLPSLWPETWCFTLGVAWRAGLRVAVFDIGAQAERVRATGQGWLLPLGLPVAAINNALLAVDA